MISRIVLVVVAALWLSHLSHLVEGAFQSEALDKIDQAIEAAITDGKTPGGVLWLECSGERYVKAYGLKSKLPEELPASVDTIYDLASLTKPLATTMAMMKLVEQGRLLIDSPITDHFPGFLPVQGEGKPVTIRHLMTHTSGLRLGLSLADDWQGKEAALQLIFNEKLRSQPGERFIYSDINFILLGFIVEEVTGMSLDTYTGEQIFKPLGMTDTFYNPDPSIKDRIAPTQQVGETLLHGVVHDPTARRLGGVAGHAGLFSTASDIALMARSILRGGRSTDAGDDESFLQSETIKTMSRVHSRGRLDSFRTLGWDFDTGYTRLRGKLFPLGGIGHTGFTGPSIWLDFQSQSFVIFLCNRVHPDGSGNVLDLREELGTLAAEALPNSVRPVAPVSHGKVMTGIDVLVAENFERLKGKKVGLVTNHTGHDSKRIPTFLHFLKSNEIDLVALFSPEHGFAGKLDSKVDDQTDAATQLPIFSLYGKTRKPLPGQLEGVDTLVFDIQDIGTRFYTYISTMGLCMEAARENDVEFLVLDRPNPLGGTIVSGPILEGDTDFVGFHNIPIRHGMTVGELAFLFLEEKPGLHGLKLHVVPCQGWTRDMAWYQTGLPWTNPSPNMRSSTQAILYPGVGVIEMADISVGRGTDTPFEIIGAPYIHSTELARELNRLEIPGIAVEPIQFTPEASKFKGELCHGVRFILTSRQSAAISHLGIALTHTLHRLYQPDFDISKVNRLLRSDSIIQSIKNHQSIPTIQSTITQNLPDFLNRRHPHLLYP